MSIPREEHDAKISALKSRIEGRFVNIERTLVEIRAGMKTMVFTGITLFVASIGTTVGTGVAAYQAMSNHFDTVLVAYQKSAPSTTLPRAN